MIVPVVVNAVRAVVLLLSLARYGSLLRLLVLWLPYKAGGDFMLLDRVLLGPGSFGWFFLYLLLEEEEALFSLGALVHQVEELDHRG